MTADPAIIEAAARALRDAADVSWFYGDDSEAKEVAAAVLAAITPMIEAAALERDAMHRGLSASETACYRWPEDTEEHKALRAAFVEGAML